LIDILRGKATEKVQQFNHDALPTFGIGGEFDEAGWRSVFRQLLAHGLLEADAQSFGGLRLTEAARPVLKGETTLSLRRQQKKSPKKIKSSAPSAQDMHKAFSAVDTPLFDALRAWRADVAREQCVPAYVVLHDKTLHELAARRPANLAELMTVPGIGQAKADRYGAALLKLVV
jgi:ATP-dependent DNA helicase RecQ